MLNMRSETLLGESSFSPSDPNFCFNLLADSRLAWPWGLEGVSIGVLDEEASAGLVMETTGMGVPRLTSGSEFWSSMVAASVGARGEESP
jgi:hypothetical protein